MYKYICCYISAPNVRTLGAMDFFFCFKINGCFFVLCKKLKKVLELFLFIFCFRNMQTQKTAVERKHVFQLSQSNGDSKYQI